MSKYRVHIVGGGIVGLCTAWYLKNAGYEVTVIDKGDFSDGTSYGNAGMIVPSHFVPMATPGVMAQGLKWMLDSRSPFYIKPRINADLLQWLYYFARSSTSSKVEQSIPILFNLNELSKELYKELAADEYFDFGYEEKGLLMLYKTQKQAEEEEQLAERAHRLGVDAKILDSNALKILEPEMDLDVLGGIYFPGDAHLYPNLLMSQMTARLKELGTIFLTNTSIADFKTTGAKITGLLTDNNQLIPTDKVILSTGSWSGHLLKKLGIKIHIQDGKGYSVTLKHPKKKPSTPTILTEAKVAITPMGSDLRIGGTLELSGLSNEVNQKRVEGILNSIPRYYNNLKIPFNQSTQIWKGYRPCTPDGLPYIGRSEKLTNLFVGTGHGMMGLSLGAVTGKVLSQLVSNEESAINVLPFRLNRF